MAKRYFEERDSYVDRLTGEHIPVVRERYRLEGRRLAFMECDRAEIFTILLELGDGPMRTMMYIAKNMEDYTNIFHGTMKSIANGIQRNQKTVVNSMMSLQQRNMIKMITYGLWFVNPQYFWTVDMDTRSDLFNRYASYESFDKRRSRTRRKNGQTNEPEGDEPDDSAGNA